MHVGITRELLNSVSNKINHDLKPKDYRLNFGVNDIDDTFNLPADHPILPKITWRDLCHLRELMPADWCDKLETHYQGKRSVEFSTKVKGQEYPERVDRKVERKAQQEEAERKLAEIDREGAVAAATLAALAA